MIVGFCLRIIKFPEDPKKWQVDKQDAIGDHYPLRPGKEIELDDSQRADQHNQPGGGKNLRDIDAPDDGHGAAAVARVAVDVLDIFDHFTNQGTDKGEPAVDNGVLECPAEVIAIRKANLADKKHEDHPGGEEGDDHVSDKEGPFEGRAVKPEENHAAGIGEYDDGIMKPYTHIETEEDA